MTQDEVIGNGFTFIYHRPDCHTFRNPESHWHTEFQSWKEAIAEGMMPCRVCNPLSATRMAIVIGNNVTFTYHEPDCHTLRNAERYRLTKFQSWEDAVAKGMKPCGVCTPTFFTLKEEEVISGIFTYHRPYCPLLRQIPPAHINRYRSWEMAEAQYKRPCNLCRPSLILTKEPVPAIAVPTTEATPQITDPDPTVSENQLSDWRRKVARLVKKLDQGRERPPGEGLAGQIGRLSRENVIPRHVAAFMKTVTEMRNVVEYESKPFLPSEGDAVRAAWKVIEEWAQGQQLDEH
jgi:methylphosphotriester-DNA--protein-cysteine methyltransferase